MSDTTQAGQLLTQDHVSYRTRNVGPVACMITFNRFVSTLFCQRISLLIGSQLVFTENLSDAAFPVSAKSRL